LIEHGFTYAPGQMKIMTRAYWYTVLSNNMKV